jgi:integrase
MEQEHEIIVVEKDLDNFPCPTDKEFLILMDSYHRLDIYRIIILIMAFCGLRVSEACALNRHQFNEDYTEFKYRINKPKSIITQTTTQVTYKVRKVIVPNWLAKDISDYVQLNEPLRNGYLFPSYYRKNPHIQGSAVRNHLVSKRRQLGLTRVWKVVLFANGKKQNHYAISPHSFRRFYISKMFMKYYDKGIDNALVKVGKILGHERPLRTTSIYLAQNQILSQDDFVLRTKLDKQIQKY